LLVRASSGLVRTVRGEELHARLPSTLDGIRDVIASHRFTPEEARSVVRMAMPDHQAFVLLPPLVSEPSVGARRLELITEPLAPGALKRLENGEIQFAVGQLGDAPAGFFRRTLYTDRYACLVRHGHPITAAAGEWTRDAYYSHRHATIAFSTENEYGEVFDGLCKILPDRESVIAATTMAAPMMVTETDLILTLPHRVAVKIAAMLPLAIVDLPVEIPPYELSLVWHERSHRNAEHTWMRSKIAAAAQRGLLPGVAPVETEADATAAARSGGTGGC
jgi:DNA-binding transcriptional LysR family regulator